MTNHIARRQTSVQPIEDIQIDCGQKLLAGPKVMPDQTDATHQWFGSEGHDPVYGARPLSTRRRNTARLPGRCYLERRSREWRDCAGDEGKGVGAA